MHAHARDLPVRYAILYDTTLGTYLSGDEFPDSTATFSRPPYAFHLDIGHGAGSCSLALLQAWFGLSSNGSVCLGDFAHQTSGVLSH